MQSCLFPLLLLLSLPAPAPLSSSQLTAVIRNFLEEKKKRKHFPEMKKTPLLLAATEGKKKSEEYFFHFHGISETDSNLRLFFRQGEKNKMSLGIGYPPAHSLSLMGSP